MSINLREAGEAALAVTLTGPLWGLPVELTGPDDGITRLYTGQVMFSFTEANPDGGEPIVVEQPAVALQLSKLVVVPKADENWFVRIPNAPSLTAPLENYALDKSRAPREDGSLGIIVLYLIRAEQK